MKTREITDCNDCGAKPGEFHQPGCDVERCPMCGGQSISCDCIYTFCGYDMDTLEEDHPDIYRNGPTEAMLKKWDDEFYLASRLPWTGLWPGVEECREYGFWCKWVEGQGWVPCGASDPEATENLTRLVLSCTWDREKKRFVLPSRRG